MEDRIPSSFRDLRQTLRTHPHTLTVEQFERSKPVLLHEAAGRRSAAARGHLREMGFPGVVDLARGYNAWVQAGQEVEGR